MCSSPQRISSPSSIATEESPSSHSILRSRSSFHESPNGEIRFGTQVYFDGSSIMDDSDDFGDDECLPYLSEAVDQVRGSGDEPLTSEVVFAPSFRKPASTAKATCSFSDLLEQTDFSEKKRKPTEPLYGANRLFVTGEEVRNPDDTNKNEQYRTASHHRCYVSKCINHLKSTCCLELAELGTEELLVDLVCEKFSYGAKYKFKPDTWTLAWEPQRLRELTTRTIQTVICAALNSKRRLQWVIGLGSGNEVIGYQISRKQRDRMRQAFDFCTSSGIFPRLPVRLARIKFHAVRGHPDSVNDERFLVEIEVRQRVGNLYQIAPDHIFYVEGDEIKDIRELNKARLIIAKQLEEQRLANATVGNRASVSVRRLCSLWPICPFVWSEFLLFSLSGVLLGIFLKRSWIRLSR